MTSTTPHQTSVRDREWEEALNRLTDRGTLTAEAASELLAEHDHLVARRRQQVRSRRILELAGYTGALLIVFGTTAVSSQLWSDITEAARLVVMAGLTVGLGLAAAAITLTTPGLRTGLRAPAAVARRRLVGVLGAAAAALAAVTTGVAVDAGGAELQQWLPLVFAIALTGALLTAWTAPGAVPTCAVSAAALGTLIATLDRSGLLDIPWAMASAVMALGVLGALVVARWLRPRVLAEFLAIAAWLVAAASALGAGSAGEGAAAQAAAAVWIGRAGLLALLVIGVAEYLHGAAWPWAAGAALALPIWVQIEFAEALGGAVAMIVAGVLLVVLSAAMTLTRRTRHEQSGPEAAAADRASPE